MIISKLATIFIAAVLLTPLFYTFWDMISSSEERAGRIRQSEQMSKMDDNSGDIMGVFIEQEYESVVVPGALRRLWLVHPRGWVGWIGLISIGLAFLLIVYSVISPVYGKSIYQEIRSKPSSVEDLPSSGDSLIRWSDFEK